MRRNKLAKKTHRRGVLSPIFVAGLQQTDPLPLLASPFAQSVATDARIAAPLLNLKLNLPSSPRPI